MKMKEDENRRLNQALEDAVQGLQKAPTPGATLPIP